MPITAPPFVQMIAGAVGKAKGPIADLGASNRDHIEWVLQNGSEEAVEALLCLDVVGAIRIAAGLPRVKPAESKPFVMEYEDLSLIAATATDLGTSSRY